MKTNKVINLDLFFEKEVMQNQVNIMEQNLQVKAILYNWGRKGVVDQPLNYK